MGVIIGRHCVANDPTTGLSPLQHALLEAPEPVRIADAPTGAGKSYAFQYGVARGQLRVLFIVPTRRLAQNLAAGLMRDLIEKEGWSQETARAKVAIWSSDETLALKARGVRAIGGYRLRQVMALDDTRDGGEIIFAIPEVVSHILLRNQLDSGLASKGIVDLLLNFHHIVFDEFHTIDPRGFGLAALCATLAAAGLGLRAKVTFMSATPLELRPVLHKLGVAASQIALLHEVIVPEGRPLHGDVMLHLTEESTLAELVDRLRAEIAVEVAVGHQVVIIYDSLASLKQQLFPLAVAFQAAGISPGRVLVINSIDDSGGERYATAGFAVGRQQNPDNFDVVIATSSVEMGVTFRAANLLIMEPGIEPLNFLQRYGRAARRGQDGQVWVRCDKSQRDRLPWRRDLTTWITTHDGQCKSIQDLTDLLSRSKQNQFKAPLDGAPSTFGNLPTRAAYVAGLYWNAVLRHKSTNSHQKRRLFQHQPSTAHQIRHLLRQVRQMGKDRMYGPPARAWCDRFEALTRTLRDIGPKCRVVEPDGWVLEVDALWLRRYTDIPERCTLRIGKDGLDEFNLRGTLEDHLLDESKMEKKIVSVLFPHTERPTHLPAGDELVAAWCRQLRDQSNPQYEAWHDFPDAMAAAEKLVRYTGMVVNDDDSLSVEARHGIL